MSAEQPLESAGAGLPRRSRRSFILGIAVGALVTCAAMSVLDHSLAVVHELHGGASPQQLAVPPALPGPAEWDISPEDIQAARAAGAQVTAAQRATFAESAERSLLEDRMDVDVTASGPANTDLVIRADIASKVVAYDFVKSGFVAAARKIGFRRVTLTDGYAQSWFWQLD